MKKSVVPRMLGLLVLYCVVFILLVIIQFTGKGHFTQRIGDMTVSGRSRASADQEVPANANEFFLTGGALVNFGGLEFNLKNREDLFDNNGFVLVDSDGERRPAVPEYLIHSGDTARFHLPGGTELAFTSLYSGSGPELRISAVFDSGVSGLEIPFKPQRSSIVRNTENEQISVLYNDMYYQFTHSARLEEKGRLFLNGENGSVSYRARPKQQGFDPNDFVVAQARRLDLHFSLWSQTGPVQVDEDMAVACGGEALRRGNYRAAVAALSPALPSARRTYESSVYLGGMAPAYRSFTALEREKLNRVTRLINSKSADFLKESHGFAFLAARGFTAQITNGLAYIRSFDPESLTLDLAPGIFEGYIDVQQLRPAAGNPFEPLIEQTRRLVSEGIQKNIGQDLSFVYLNDSAEIEFNLRLGKAIQLWAAAAGGENTGGDEWAALGRSLILSAPSKVDSSGSAPQALVRSETGETGETPDSRISAARLYRILNPGEYYPHAAAIGAGTSNIWAWTAAPSVSAVQNEETLDISVSFLVNETHYMLIRGVRPFGRIQLYGIDFRSDPQFERYDSSGWVYYPADQTLVLKMKHRSATELIRIFFRQEIVPAAAVPPEAAAEGGGSSAAAGGNANANTNAGSETGAP